MIKQRNKDLTYSCVKTENNNRYSFKNEYSI